MKVPFCQISGIGVVSHLYHPIISLEVQIIKFVVIYLAIPFGNGYVKSKVYHEISNDRNTMSHIYWQ